MYYNNESTSSKVKEDDDDYYACFKILQIADIHLGEAENLDWGPEQDRKTWLVLDRVLKLEQPDLIVLSGDQLTGNNCKENATAYYQMLGEFLSKYNTPWATIFGNHDDLGFVDPVDGKQNPEPKYSRRDLLEIDQSFPLSLSQLGPDHVFGTSNYVLDILNHEGGPVLAAQILLLDSGGGSLPEVIDESQLKWLHEQQQGNTINIPAVAFQHIPTLSHAYHTNSQQLHDECTGMNGDHGMAPLESDAGIVQALVEAKRYLFLAVGHNHGNDYCCPYHSHSEKNSNNNSATTTMDEAASREHLFSSAFHLCFGRHSGYGGYGKWERGARVYELKKRIDFHDAREKGGEPHNEERNSIRWKSWVRLESGEIIDQV
ncbi:unnamed protein product [Cylindrotheca closterium]|uniref:Calcineurin-like phosphoesterase domain-containing protein n=1 Tax=Cylindrotheca closterium TaxID=2856 RepID=A0AAD2FHA5_9STRA|nr:unnamed protein product [Cylindrotheca closterium]